MFRIDIYDASVTLIVLHKDKQVSVTHLDTVAWFEIQVLESNNRLFAFGVSDICEVDYEEDVMVLTKSKGEYRIEIRVQRQGIGITAGQIIYLIDETVRSPNSAGCLIDEPIHCKAPAAEC